ncbi:MAG: NADH-quinone oxidoreductase subunit NuoN [Pseudomonadota bacterium]|nr:NADH-quinone oxidoreductase subunit NuoN [Pseudomonadota bacterium]
MLSPVMVMKPEIILTVFGMILLVHGAWRGDDDAKATTVMALIGLVAAAGFLFFPQYGDGFHLAGPAVLLFDHMYIQDGFARFTKILLLAGSFLSLLMSLSALEQDKIDRSEYPVLILFATVGMMLMVSAGDFLSLYVGLELQSLTLYVLAAFKRDDARSSESGLKYFVLGALSSGLILYGISLIYGFAGTTQFEGLARAFQTGAPTPLAVTFGVVFVCAAMAFKVSAAPFHMWTPDVYEGAPTPVTAFFASAPKLAALALFTRVLIQPLGGLVQQWAQIIIFVAVASMLLGSFAGLMQTNLKRLLAYSSIANAGYALVGLAAGGIAGVQALLLYLAIYFLNTLGAFGVILCLRRQGKMCEQVTDLAGLGKANPLLAFAMVIFMFSLAGVPPLAGFFGKYFIFLAAVEAHLTPLAVLGVLSSVVAAFYYLRIIKLMYFDETTMPLDRLTDRGLRAVLVVTSLAMLLFILWPAPTIEGARDAAASLFPVASN